MKNIEAIKLRLPDNGEVLECCLFNGTHYADESELLLPGETWCVLFFKKKHAKPGQKRFYSSEIVKYITPKGFDFFDGESFNMN